MPDGLFVDDDAPPLTVHPLAAIFPMLPDDELADLAEDIKANGLIHSIMLDQAGKVLVDGRNRLAACEIADVEPHFERLPPGIEPADYIASVNLARRHMTAGQRAMSLAMLFPDPERTKRAGSSVAKERKVSEARLSLARAVLRVAPDDLAPQVLSGSTTLDIAFAEVKRRQQAAMSEEAQLARLRAEAPDVAALVVEGTLSLIAGLAELDQRDRNKRATIESGHRSAERIASSFAADAIAILSAIELGAAIKLDDSQQTQINQTLDLLLREGVLT
jgi:ParB-like chromosome segregation protein Spo0J